MQKITFKMNLILSMGIITMLAILIFIDEDILKSLVLQDNDIDNLIIEEIAYTTKTETNTKTETTNNKNNPSQVVIKDKVNNTATTLNSKPSNTWVWPTNKKYTITSSYGARWGSQHKAIDISGTGYGSNIYAANDGIVTTVKGGCVTGNFSCNGKGGNYIIIKHSVNNYYTVYMHLKDIKVKKGATVKRGQVIGTMGNTGNVYPRPKNKSSKAGTHLHFALYIGEPYKGGYAVNPMRLY